jgi:RND family efflux transporter MFP subunit
MERLFADSAVPVAQLEAARAGFLQAEGQANAASAELAYASLVAPFAGLVTARYSDPGDLTSPGQPVLVIEEAGPREVVVGVPEGVATGLKAGQEVAVTLGAEGRRVTARIVSLVPAADPVTRTLEVRLVSPAPMTTGLTAIVEFPLARPKEDRLSVPRSALVERGELTGVYLFSPDSTVRLRWVRLGPATGETVEVVSGLLPGDLVVVKPTGILDGTPARPSLARPGTP